MTNSINPVSSQPIRPVRSDMDKTGDVYGTQKAQGNIDKSPSPVKSAIADMAAMGAPIDGEKIEQLRDQIGRGEYPLDAKAIADKMVEMDLPRLG